MMAVVVLGMISTLPSAAADYAGQISAFRRAQGLSAVTLDSKLNAVALFQAQAMSASGKVSHDVGGLFPMRIAKLRKAKAAENIAAGFLTFPETLKQWQDSAGHRANLLMPGAKKLAIIIRPAIGRNQNDSALRRGNAMSGAPIISGRTKFASPANTGMMNRKISSEAWTLNRPL